MNSSKNCRRVDDDQLDDTASTAMSSKVSKNSTATLPKQRSGSLESTTSTIIPDSPLQAVIGKFQQLNLGRSEPVHHAFHARRGDCSQSQQNAAAEPSSDVAQDVSGQMEASTSSSSINSSNSDRKELITCASATSDDMGLDELPSSEVYSKLKALEAQSHERDAQLLQKDALLLQKDAQLHQRDEEGRPSTVEECRADFNTLLLSILPKLAAKSASDNLDELHLGKRLPEELHYGFIQVELLNVTLGLLTHVLAQEPCVMPRITVKEFLEDCVNKDSVRGETAYRELWTMNPAKYAPKIVLAMAAKYRKYSERPEDFPKEVQQSFNDLIRILPKLEDAEVWPTAPKHLENSATPVDLGLKHKLWQRIKTKLGPKAGSIKSRQQLQQGTSSTSTRQQSKDTSKDKYADISKHVSDFYILFKKPTSLTRLAHIIEIKAFHVDNSTMLWELISALEEEAVQKGVPVDQGCYVFKPGKDTQKSAVISQAYSYSLTEGCPLVIVNTGLFHLFFRTDFKSGKCCFYCNYAKPYSSQAPEHNHSKEDRGKVDKSPWAKKDLLASYVAALLQGIHDAIELDAEERFEKAETMWYETKSEQDVLTDSKKSLEKEEEEEKPKEQNEGGVAAREQGSSTSSESSNVYKERKAKEGGKLFPGSKDHEDKHNPDGDDVAGGGGGGGGSGSGSGPSSSSISNNNLFDAVADPIAQHRHQTGTILPSSPPSSEGHIVSSSNDCEIIGKQMRNPRASILRPKYPSRNEMLILTDQFCSEQCLQSLKHDSVMDPSCPNFKLHRGDRDVGETMYHTIAVQQIVQDLEAKLRCGEITHVMEPILGCRGFTAQLFRVVHPTLGYAFAAKGVNNLRTKWLQQEASVYEHIYEKAMQKPEGMHAGYPLLTSLRPYPVNNGDLREPELRIQVPISFGIIKPRPEHLEVMYPLWYVDGVVETENALAYNTFLLLSYHGESLIYASEWQYLEKKFNGVPLNSLGVKCDEALQRLGVDHDDLHCRNLLSSPGLDAVFVIDFGFSTILVEGANREEQSVLRDRSIVLGEVPLGE